MNEIHAVTFDVGDDTIRICEGIIMIWKGVTDHPADCKISVSVMKKMLAASELADEA